MFMTYQHTKFHTPSYSDPIVTAIAIKYGIQTAAILPFCTLKKKEKNPQRKANMFGGSKQSVTSVALSSKIHASNVLLLQISGNSKRVRVAP